MTTPSSFYEKRHEQYRMCRYLWEKPVDPQAIELLRTMNNPHSPYTVDIESKTVTHKQTGILMRFEKNPDGGWDGLVDPATITGNFQPNFLAGLARRMGSAWASHLSRKRNE
jgi:hypothetical protein